MTKTELCEKILSYPPTARIDIWWDGGVSNMPLDALQGLVREWKEQNVPQGTPLTKLYPEGIHASASGRIYTEPDPDVLPDYNS